MVHLPQEVFSHICSYLVITARPSPTYRDVEGEQMGPSRFTAEDQLNLRTMLSISLASSSLHQAVKPYLYRTITPPMTVSESLLRALLVPSTARLVKFLSTDSWTSAYDQRDNYGPLPHAQIEAAMSNKGLSKDLQDDIRRDIGLGRADAMFAILLLLCTNLRVWMTSFERDCCDDLMVRAISQAVASNSALQQLLQFDLRFAIDEEVAELWELRPIFDAPRLRLVRGTGIHLDGWGSGNFPNTPHPSIRHIFLACSSIDLYHGLPILLRGCECLESLSLG